MGAGMVTAVWDKIAFAVSWLFLGVLGDCMPFGGVNRAVLRGLRFFFGRRISSFFGAW
jgi:hypothetical protein